MFDRIKRLDSSKKDLTCLQSFKFVCKFVQRSWLSKLQGCNIFDYKCREEKDRLIFIFVNYLDDFFIDLYIKRPKYITSSICMFIQNFPCLLQKFYYN